MSDIPRYIDLLEALIVEGTFSRLDDLNAYLNGLDEVVRDELLRRWDKSGHYLRMDTSNNMASNFCTDFAAWAARNHLIPQSDYARLRNAIIQWLHERKGVDMGYGQRFLKTK